MTLLRYEVLNWREIFDCKSRDMHIDDCAKLALECGYKYFCHNDMIYMIDYKRDGIIYYHFTGFNVNDDNTRSLR